MVKRTVVVANPSGLHARPAAKLVDFVKGYPGTVELEKDGRRANLKSILMLLSLGVAKGTEITLWVDGTEEEAFADSLAEFVLNLEG